MTNGEKFKTAKERAKAFSELCLNIGCNNCPIQVICVMGNLASAGFAWLNLEFEEEKPMPCPFCGGKCRVADLHSMKLVRCNCGYHSTLCNANDDAISAHNRVCREVKAREESEVAR